MSDIETSLPEWAVSELHKPVRTSAEQRDRIMELVRVAPRPRRRSSAAFHPRWFRRGVLSAPGAAIAAVMTLMLSMAGYTRSNVAPEAVWSEATVIGDTVVSEGGVTTRLANAIADTLRIVRFALRAPNASRVALSGDFNSWNRSSTYMTYDKKTGEWIARIAVPRSAKRYAFVVDGDRWMGAPTPVAVSAGALIYADSI